MKLFRYTTAGRTGLGLIRPGHDDQFIDLSKLDASLAADMTPFYDDATRQRVAGLLAKAAASEFQPLSSVRFDLPIAHPPKIICLGLNYADHAKEGGHARPEYPSFFMRVDTSMTAHQAPIVRPKVSTKLDYEAELAVVIGKQARHQWTIGKNFDQTGGFGPWIVTADELPPGAHGLRIQSILNGQVMQDANTSDFLWNVKESLVIISECITLMPGDVIITGTPAGVGYARTPPVFMKQGDVCDIVIEGVGTLRNPIVDEA